MLGVSPVGQGAEDDEDEIPAAELRARFEAADKKTLMDCCDMAQVCAEAGMGSFVTELN